MGVMALFFVVYARNWRQVTLKTFATWLMALAFITTFLIANRGVLTEQRYGEWAPLEEAVYLQSHEGNEFIYGGAAILVKLKTWDFYWGRRHIVTYLIRPIPRHFWPEKYEEAAWFLGLPDWNETNFGVFDQAAVSHMGWVAPLGAAPGLVADLWIDFGPLAPVVGGLISYTLARLWARGREGGLRAYLVYGSAFVLLGYLVTQSQEAYFVRLVLVGVITWLFATWLGVEKAAGRGPTVQSIPRGPQGKVPLARYGPMGR